MSSGTAEGSGSPPRVYRCLNCKAPIPDLAIATDCEVCGAYLGEDRFLTELASREVLAEVRERREGCINCGTETSQVFCTTECSEAWFSKYTDAFLR